MKKMILAALLVVGGATTASADPLMKYTYADLSYQWTHVDVDPYEDSNGLDTKVSYSPIENFALEGGYNYANSGFTNAGSNINQSLFRYGGAAWYSFCNGVDLVGRVGGTHVQFDSSGADTSDNGVYTGAGLRYLLTDTLEGNIDALYDNANSIFNPKGGNWTYTGTLLNALTDDLALKVSAGVDVETNVALTAGLRLAM